MEHKELRKQLLARCAHKARSLGEQPKTLIRQQIDKPAYIPRRKDRPTPKPMNFRFKDTPRFTAEQAIKGLCAKSNSKYPEWVASYLHGCLLRLKRLRNRPRMHRGILETYLTEQVRLHVPYEYVDRVVRTISRWVYPEANEADYFYPVTYSELRIGRKRVALAGGGKLHRDEVVHPAGMHADEVPPDWKRDWQD